MNPEKVPNPCDPEDVRPDDAVLRVDAALEPVRPPGSLPPVVAPQDHRALRKLLKRRKRALLSIRASVRLRRHDYLDRETVRKDFEKETLR